MTFIILVAVDTIYTQKQIVVPGQTVDLTPEWIKWLMDKRLALTVLTFILAVMGFIFWKR